MVSDMYSSGYIVQTAMVRQLQFKQQQICANHASYASLQNWITFKKLKAVLYILDLNMHAAWRWQPAVGRRLEALKLKFGWQTGNVQIRNTAS